MYKPAAYPSYEETGLKRPTIAFSDPPVDKHRLVVQHYNIVSTCTLGESIDIIDLVGRFPLMFGRTRAASAIIRLYRLNTTCTLSRGKVNIVGARHAVQALVGAWTCVKLLRDRGIPHVIVRKFTVHNLTASSQMGYYIDTPRMVNENSDVCSAQFDLFPGARVRSPHSSLVATVFHQGKINITGSRTIDESREAYIVLQALLAKYVVLGETEMKRVTHSIEMIRKHASKRATPAAKRRRRRDPDDEDDDDEEDDEADDD